MKSPSSIPIMGSHLASVPLRARKYITTNSSIYFIHTYIWLHLHIWLLSIDWPRPIRSLQCPIVHTVSNERSSQTVSFGIHLTIVSGDHNWPIKTYTPMFTFCNTWQWNFTDIPLSLSNFCHSVYLPFPLMTVPSGIENV